jgi:hypothetical protein
MNGDFQRSTSFAERFGTVHFAIFHPYSSLKGCRDGMPEVTKRIKPQLFQPRRKLKRRRLSIPSPSSSKAGLKARDSKRFLLKQEPWMKQKGLTFKNFSPETFNN